IVVSSSNPQRSADHCPIAGSAAHSVPWLAIGRLLDAAQFALPARLLRLLQRALLAVFVDRVFGPLGLPARVAPRDLEHAMAAHDAAGDAQLAGVAVGIADHRAVSARLADLLLGSVSPIDRGVECGKPVAILEIAKVGLV